MNDPTERAIDAVQHQWNNTPSATVIPFPTPAERMRQEWMRKHTRPMPAPPTPPSPSRPAA